MNPVLAPDTQWHVCITDHCNLRCLMCRMWAEPDPAQIDPARLLAFFRSCRASTPGAQVNLVGGEPLLHPDWPTLCTGLASLGFRVSLNTNGSLLDEARCRLLARSGLETLIVSLDSLRPGVHDGLRGCPGLLERLLEGLARLRREGQGRPPVMLITVLSAQNLADVPDLVRYVEDRDDLAGIYFMALMRPHGDTGPEPWRARFPNLWPADAREADAALDFLQTARLRSRKIFNSARQLDVFRAYFSNPDGARTPGCRAFGRSVLIDARGRVRPCPQKPEAGLIGQTSCDEMLRSPAWARAQAAAETCPLPCETPVNCSFE